MKKIFTLIILLIFSTLSMAQTPDQISYQAVVRDGGNNLISNQTIGVQISILQGTTTGNAVYIETHTPESNENGLVTFEIGTGTVVSGDFSTIDWSSNSYFVQTDMDPAGGANYTITAVSQLLSVPYAMHAKTAETVSGGINETDPVFAAWDKSTGIFINESQISDFGNYVETESDPEYLASEAANITATDITNLGNLSGTNTGDQDISGIATNIQSIQDTASQIRSDIPDVSGFLTSETDPVYSGSEAANITATDITNLGNLSGVNTGDQDISGIATNAQSIQDTALQIRSDIPDVSGFLTSETDPVYSGSEAANITATDITNLGNLSGTNTGDQDISGIVTNTQSIQDTASQIRSDIPDVSGFLTSETDPNVPTGTQTGEMQYWSGSEWVTVSAGNEGQVLIFESGVPIWKTQGEVENPTTGKIWMDRNLGALRVAGSSTDADAYGDLYQWGRAGDGHQLSTSGTTATLSNSDTPSHGDFITKGSSPYDWRSPQNDNLWQGVNGTNNPCPSGYRLPTEAEWEAERTSWSNNNAAGAFASPLKLLVAGLRSYSNGSLRYVGTLGHYWSSTVDGTRSRYLYFNSSAASVRTNPRAFGLSVRCLKD